MRAEAIWRRLCDANLVCGEMPSPDTEAAHWPIRLLLGFAGWLAALLLFGFFALAIDDLYDNAIGMMTLGAALCGAATLLFRAPRSQIFVQQLGLAFALAGQAALWWGVYQWYDGNRVGAHLSVVAIELALVWLMPNHLHRILAALAAGCFFYLALSGLGVPGMAAVCYALLFVLLWLNESQWLDRAALFEPVGIALALLLLVVSVGVDPIGFGHRSSAPPTWTGVLTDIATGMIFVGAIAKLLQQTETPWRSGASIAALAGAVLLAVLCAPAPGMLPALLVLLVGFARGHRFIWVLGMLALIGYSSHYYYSLEYTLLAKSAVLAVTGIALLLARAVMHRLGGAHA